MLCVRGQAMKQKKKSRSVCLLILAGLLRAAEAVPVKANVSLFYFNSSSNSTETDKCECGLYGVHSPVADARGLVVIPNSTNLQACTWDTEFVASKSPWVALIERGNCTFSEKINRAAVQGAEAVVIYNSRLRGNYTVPMAHPGFSVNVVVFLKVMAPVSGFKYPQTGPCWYVLPPELPYHC